MASFRCANVPFNHHEVRQEPRSSACLRVFLIISQVIESSGPTRQASGIPNALARSNQPVAMTGGSFPGTMSPIFELSSRPVAQWR